MSQQHNTVGHKVEILGVASARIDGEPQCLIALRLDPKSTPMSFNMALSVEQFYRLRDDLNRLARRENSIRAAAGRYEDQYVDHWYEPPQD